MVWSCVPWVVLYLVATEWGGVWCVDGVYYGVGREVCVMWGFVCACVSLGSVCCPV